MPMLSIPFSLPFLPTKPPNHLSRRINFTHCMHLALDAKKTTGYHNNNCKGKCGFLSG